MNERKDFNFEEFKLPNTNQAKAIVEALRYNDWFEELIIKQPPDSSRLKDDLIGTLANSLKDNSVLQKLVLHSVGSPSAFYNHSKVTINASSLVDSCHEHFSHRDRLVLLQYGR